MNAVAVVLALSALVAVTAANPVGGYAAGPIGGYAAGPIGGYAGGLIGGYAAGPIGGYAAGPIGGYAAGPIGGYAGLPLAGIAPAAAAVAPLAAAIPAAPIAPVAAVAPAVAIDRYAYPRYAFGYGVSDALTGDNKNHVEVRDGPITKGQYSLAEPDGTIRVVNYVADSINGFNAVVSRIGASAHPAPAYAGLALGPVAGKVIG